MSKRVQRVAKKGSKILGYFLFLFLFLFNIQIGFSDNWTDDLEFFGMNISLVNDINAAVLKDDPESGGGGGAATAYCESTNCIGGCAVTGQEAYCSSYNCACSCIYRIGSTWYHYSLNCPGYY